MAKVTKKAAPVSKTDVLSIDERRELFVMGYKKLAEEYGITLVAQLAIQDIKAPAPTAAPAAAAEEAARTKSVN